jgi:hypothetical protein
MVLGMGNDSSDATREADMYVSVFNGRLPTTEDSDLRAETNGPDYLSINSDDSFFASRPTTLIQGPSRILVIVGVRALSANTSFTLLNWGPNIPSQNEAFYSYADLTAARPNQTVQF